MLTANDGLLIGSVGVSGWTVVCRGRELKMNAPPRAACDIAGPRTGELQDTTDGPIEHL